MPQNFLDSTRRSIAQIKKHMDQDELKIAPPFQRNPVWSNKQRSYLIDTVLRGYPIPEIYVQELVDSSGEQKFVVVDGQQRIRACLDFIAGEYELSEPQNSPWFEKRFQDLSSAEKEQIFSYNFMVRQLPELEEAEIVDIFKRINRNTVSLNKQELRHATYWGEFIQCVEGISNDPHWSALGIFSANDIRRMLDVEFISELVIAVLHGLQNKKAELDKYYVLYEEQFDDGPEIDKLFRKLVVELSAVLALTSTNRWRKKSDFYSLFLALETRNHVIPLSEKKRSVLVKTLDDFGNRVDAYLRGDLRVTRALRHVKKYGDAVERAATDLANRRARHKVLTALLDGASIS
jgi:hypothetical protein